MNETIENIAEYEHWVVLLRRGQITAGSLVLACKGPATSLPQVGPEAFAELTQVTSGLEHALRSAFQFDRINYVLLMMVDPQVHYHVVPRYETNRSAAGLTFEDTRFPGPPDVASAIELDDRQMREMRDLLQSHWPEGDQSVSAARYRRS